jgi:argonaute-like protein implicated in RNA metabolism and viral defense
MSLMDPDMQNATAALIRAAERAREIARRTGTAVVVMRDGQLVREIPRPMRKKRSRKAT